MIFTSSVTSNLNDFDALWSQLQTQKMTMEDDLKCVFLLYKKGCYALKHKEKDNA